MLLKVIIVALVAAIQLSSNLVLDESFLYRLIAITVVVSFLIIVFLSKKRGKVLYLDFFTFLVFALILITLISSISAKSIALSIAGLVKFLLFFIFYQLLYSQLKVCGNKLIVFIIKAVVLAFLFSCISATSQILQLNTFSYENIYLLTGISGHKNLYSSFILLTVIASLLGFQFLKKNRVWTFMLIVTLALQIGFIIFLRTRAVIMATALSSIIYVLLHFVPIKKIAHKKLLIRSIIISLLLSAFISFSFPQIVKKVSGSIDTDNSAISVVSAHTIVERLLVWEKSYQLINDNFWFGVGLGSWKKEVSQYAVPRIYKVQDLNVIFQRPHNEYIKVLAELGIFGLMLFLFLIVYLLLAILNSRDSINYRNINILVAGFIGFLCIMFFSFPLERVEHNLILIFLLCIAVYYINPKSIAIKGKPLNVAFALNFLLCLLVFSVVQSKFKSAVHIKNMYAERALNNNSKVIECVDKAISSITKYDDFSVPLYWYRGNANATIQNYADALHDFKLAEKYSPYNANVLNDLGSAYFVNGLIDQAIVNYEKACFINPRFDDPKLNLVAIYLQLGNLDKAKQWEKSILKGSKRRNQYKQVLYK